MYFYFFIFFFKVVRAQFLSSTFNLYTLRKKKRILFLVLYIWLCWLWVCNILLLLVVIKTVRGIGRRARLRDRLSSSQHDCHPWVVFIPSPLFFFFLSLYSSPSSLYDIVQPKCNAAAMFPPFAISFFFFFFLSLESLWLHSNDSFNENFRQLLLFSCVPHSSVKWIALSLSLAFKSYIDMAYHRRIHASI